jgi:predicted membrane protein
METKETNKQVNFHPYHKLNKFVTALIFVVAGIVILGHNVGVVNDYAYRIIISWQMLLIVWGIASLIKRNLMLGCLFFGIGIYFLLPHITGIDGTLLSDYWPVLLILFGLILLFQRHKSPWHRWHHHPRYYNKNGGAKRTEQVTDGFVTVDVSFGNSRHIVLDPVFRGADLDASFGSIILDLRRTTLEGPETYIDVDCSFGGVEIFVPSHWCLLTEIDNTCGSCEDKRYTTQEIDMEHKLILRGDVSFGALEIKN